MTSLGWKFVIYSFIIFALNVDLQIINGDSMCERKSKEKNRYRICFSDDNIWCDLSLRKIIPQPKDMEKLSVRRKASTAIGLFINDSCVASLEKNDLVGYPKIRVINLANNSIETIPKAVFENNKDLERIDLSVNLITDISQQAFAGLTKLTYLKLDNNRITGIQSGTFSILAASLQFLSIQNNQLASIDIGQFNGLKNLETLNLKDNRISHIDGSAFFSLNSINELYLDGILIREFTNNMFDGLENLEILSISNNEHFDKLPDGFGKNFRNLRTLNISSNNLGNLNSDSFDDMKKLEKLDLGNNSLTEVSEALFLKNTYLTFIDLSHNYIEDIPKETFQHLRQLMTLLLQNNKLSTPHKEWFAQLVKQIDQRMIEVNISGNEWNCDCNILEFWDFAENLKRSRSTTSTTLADQLEIKCRSPKLVKDDILNTNVALHIKNRDSQQCKKSSTTKAYPISSREQQTPKKITIITNTTTSTTPITPSKAQTINTPKLLQVQNEHSTDKPTSIVTETQIGEKSNLKAIIIALGAVIVIIILGVLMWCRCRRLPLFQAKLNSKKQRNDSGEPFLDPNDAILMRESSQEPFSSDSSIEGGIVLQRINPRQGRLPSIPTQISICPSRSSINDQYHQSNLTYQSVAPFTTPDHTQLQHQTYPQMPLPSVPQAPYPSGHQVMITPSPAYSIPPSMSQVTRPKEIRTGYGSLGPALWENNNNTAKFDDIRLETINERLPRVHKKSLCENCGHESMLEAITRPKRLYTSESSVGEVLDSLEADLSRRNKPVRYNSMEDVFESCESLAAETKPKLPVSIPLSSLLSENSNADSNEALQSIEFFSIETRADGDGAEARNSLFSSLNQNPPIS
uniref:leucine-rich repeat-containing protein 15-like n=1 Tax=Styela clava TaxID=7725 RepID=UPI001939E5B0|nr:leucine-rich repeat-containing protein 15-like [Styela clava]